MPDLVPLVDLSRNGILECRHFGAVAVADTTGRVIAQAGDPYSNGPDTRVKRTYGNTSTQARLSWKPVDSLRIRATWGKSFLTPQPQQQFGLTYVDDGTNGLTRSGIASFIIPSQMQARRLFSQRLFWFRIGQTRLPRTVRIRGIHPNAVWASNVTGVPDFNGSSNHPGLYASPCPVCPREASTGCGSPIDHSTAG